MDQIRQPTIIGFYGYSQSGKTTLISSVIHDLNKRGISIGVVKITDKPISSEPEKKDTQIFRQSGAEITAFSSSVETSFVVQHAIEIQNIVKTLSQMSDVELVIIEGAHSVSIPKIRIGDIPLRPNTLFTFSGNIDEIVKLIEKMLYEKRTPNEYYD
jgi:molybdopterin-guanine dinucleotide biosynthesis adapter protein